MQDSQHEEEENQSQSRNPCNLRIPQSLATQMGTLAHSVRPLDCGDTMGTTVMCVTFNNN